MGQMFTTGTWMAKEGQATEFVEAWTEFATWANSMPGAGTLRLTRDRSDEQRFVSFRIWDDAESAHRWKAEAEFRARMGKVQQYVAAFTPAELDVVRVIG